MMDLKELRRLAEACEEVSPSPWQLREDFQQLVFDRKNQPIVSVWWPDRARHAYIAAADPATVLGLIAEVERLRTLDAAARAWIENRDRLQAEPSDNLRFWMQAAETAMRAALEGE